MRDSRGPTFLQLVMPVALVLGPFVVAGVVTLVLTVVCSSDNNETPATTSLWTVLSEAGSLLLLTFYHYRKTSFTVFCMCCIFTTIPVLAFI